MDAHLPSEPALRADGRPAGARLPHRSDVEGLRGLAILMVVAYHVGMPGAAGGYVGVDVFFVLSGFLITSLLAKELEHSGRIDFVSFYARRVRRLLPAAFLVLIVTLGVCRFLYAPFEQQGFMGTAVATAAYMSNIWFAKESVDYLAPDTTRNPFLHTWSLAVEEQFYFVWPLILLALVRLGRRAASAERWIIGGLGTLVLVSLGVSYWLTAAAQPLAFFLLPSRAWEFAAGGLGALVIPRLPPLSLRLTQILSGIALAVVLGSGAFFNDRVPFPGLAALLPVGGTVALLMLPTPAHFFGPTRWLSSRVLGWFGRLSYSWYLWHWPVLIVMGTLPAAAGFGGRLVAVAIALVLAAVTYRLVEHPLRVMPALLPRPRLSVALGVILTFAGVSLAWSAREHARTAAARPDQLAFTAAWAAVPPIYADGCHLGFLQTASPACVFGDPQGARSLALLGDSHAAQWFPALDLIARKRGLGLLSLTKSACPAADVRPFEAALGREYIECQVWRDGAIERIIAARVEGVVVAGRPAIMSSADPSGSFDPDEWTAALRRTLSRFSSAGIPVLLLAETPDAGFDVPSCLARRAWNPTLFRGGCTFHTTSLRQSVQEAERRATAGLPGVAFADPAAELCNGSTCETSWRGEVAYRDAHHLTTAFAASREAFIGERLDQVIRVKRVE